MHESIFEYKLVEDSNIRWLVFNGLGLHGKKKLIKINGTLNSEKSINFLKFHLLLDIEEGEIFQPDVSPCHTLLKKT